VHEVDHSLAPKVEVKNGGVLPPLSTHLNVVVFKYFFFLVAPTRGSLLPLRSIGLSFLSFLI
jgi:hypothetical protein